MLPKKPMLQSKMGAQVMYCGHAGYFMADIFVVEGAAVVKASGPVTPDKLYRRQEFGPPTHLLVDFPSGGLWEPRRGIFVVPANQVTVWERDEA